MTLYFVARGVFVPFSPEEEKVVKDLIAERLKVSIKDPDYKKRPLNHWDLEIFAGLTEGTEEYQRKFDEVCGNTYEAFVHDARSATETMETLYCIEEGDEKLVREVESLPNFVKWMPEGFNRLYLGSAEEYRRE